MGDKKCTAEDVIFEFNDFLATYEKFRVDNGLKDKVVNPFELCTALMDKSGRIARQIKHFERKDAKEDWPDGLTEAMTGYLIYMILILKHYNLLYSSQGMRNELNSAIKQWSEKKEG